jgi:alpha-1,3-mannosyltransferase
VAGSYSNQSLSRYAPEEFFEDSKYATKSRATRQLLGVPVAISDRASAVSRIDGALAAGEVLKIAFANAHTLNIAARDAKFRTALQDFYVLNDGLGVDIASRIKFGMSFPENLNGTDFIPRYLEQSRHALRLFLLGATARVVEGAAEAFQKTHPRHTIAGFHQGYLTADSAPRVRAMIAAAKVDAVIVGMGNPLQELWIQQNAVAAGAKLYFGAGALFDFAAGNISRAPAWVRSLRCEWMYRLASEPRRLWRRYLIGNGRFLLSVLRDRHAPPAPAAQPAQSAS